MRIMLSVLTFGMTGLVAAGAAWADLAPRPGNLQPESRDIYFAVGAAVVLVVGVCVGALMSSKRTHLD